MARKSTKGRTTKKVARKKVARKKVAAVARKAGKATGKARKVVSKRSASTPVAPGPVESPRAMDVLRAWSPARYTTR
jgi:hypothetical protein